MMNFIVVDDIEFFRKQVHNTIIRFNAKVDVKNNSYIFNEYNDDFKKISKEKLQNKVYILDIETKKSNGIDEARKIRLFDQTSPIIFLTLYENTYCGELLRSRLSFIFISKTDKTDFNKILLDYFLKLYYDLKSKTIKLDNTKTICNIPYKDILYFYSNDGKTIVKTFNSDIPIKLSLIKLSKILNDDFFQVHRAYIANLKNIVFIGKKIIFIDGTELTNISKYRKNDVIKAYKKEQNYSALNK